MRNGKKVTVIYQGLLKDLDEDLVFKESFYKLTPAQKLKEAWNMVKYVWKLKGRDQSELRFNRTTSVFKRR